MHRAHPVVCMYVTGITRIAQPLLIDTALEYLGIRGTLKGHISCDPTCPMHTLGSAYLEIVQARLVVRVAHELD